MQLGKNWKTHFKSDPMDSQPEIGHKQESTVEYVEIGSKEWRAGKKDLLEEMDSHEGEQESRIEIYTDRLRDKRDESSTDGDNDEDDNTSYDEDDNGVDEGDDSKDKEDDDASTFLKMIGSLLGQIPKVTSATQYLRSQTTKNTAQTTPTQRTITTTFQQPTVQTAQAPTISTVQRPALYITMVTSKQGTTDQKSTNRITGSTTVNVVPSSGSATWTRPTPAATNAGTATIYYTRTTATPLLGANTKSHPVPSFKTTQSPFITTRSTTMNTPGFINTTTSPSKGGNQRQSQSQSQQYGYQVGLGTTTTKQTSTTSANVNLTTGVATVPVTTFHHQKSASSSTAPGKLTTTGPTRTLALRHIFSSLIEIMNKFIKKIIFNIFNLCLPHPKGIKIHI